MGSGPNQQDRDGGVDVYPADAADLESYRRAEAELAQLRIPLLLRSDNPHDRLFVAGLDGTGNSMFDDKPENWSVVAKIYQQVKQLRENQGISNISGGYVEGTFTQSGFLQKVGKPLDGMLGYTFDERVETAYFQLCTQAKAWLHEDPDAQIRIAGVGFSRGAEQVAALLRMVEERGIRDPDGARYGMNRENLITHIQYADRPPLVAPGQTLQAALLFDPVSTGVREHDRRLPPSVLSALQITAEDERRNLFPASLHLPEGFSEDRRHYHAVVGGAHSNIGDTYARNGLGSLSFNLGVDFLNRLSDRDFLQARELPQDPAQYVVHRSDQGMNGLYRTSHYDRTGERNAVTALAPATACPQVPAECTRKAPVSTTLDAQVERRVDQDAAKPLTLDDVFERLYQSTLNGDDAAMGRAAADFMSSPLSESFRADVAREREWMEAQEREQARMWQEQQEAPVRDRAALVR